MLKNKQIIPLFYDTYIAVIKNSAGSNLFRDLYARVNGKKTNITKNGELSCAFFVSSVLMIFGLIKAPHATVDGTIKDLEKSGWELIKKPKIGGILVWEKTGFEKKDAHKHIGFYIGRNKAISNNFKLGQPCIHRWTSGTKKGKPNRKVEAIYWRKKLNSGLI